MKYQLLKLTKKGHLILWDGPNLDKVQAKKLLKVRSKQHPKDKFFVYKEES
jgi:hypothetical protein